MNSFKFELGQIVAISVSGEQGKIIGRAEYINSGRAYFLRYKCGDGRAVETWWPEDALETTE